VSFNQFTVATIFMRQILKTLNLMFVQELLQNKNLFLQLASDIFLQIMSALFTSPYHQQKILFKYIIPTIYIAFKHGKYHTLLYFAIFILVVV
jgi:hypothetical protein